MIIGLTGKRRAGKDTAAMVLTEQRGFTAIKFAEPLKAMVRTLLEIQGVPNATILNLIEGDMKEVNSRYFGGRSSRHVMQTLGTEWGRNLIDENFWVNICMIRTANLKDVVVTDCRFLNEVNAIRNGGGVIINIDRNTGNVDSHVSENALATFEPDYNVENNGTVAELHKNILTVLAIAENKFVENLY